MLSAKYIGGARPEGTRFFLFEDYFARLLTLNGAAATERYAALARQHGLEPAVMAIAYTRARPFMTSVIIGVRTMDQLEMDLQSVGLDLSDEVLEGINAIHNEYTNPCP